MTFSFCAHLTARGLCRQGPHGLMKMATIAERMHAAQLTLQSFQTDLKLGANSIDREFCEGVGAMLEFADIVAAEVPLCGAPPAVDAEAVNRLEAALPLGSEEAIWTWVSPRYGEMSDDKRAFAAAAQRQLTRLKPVIAPLLVTRGLKEAISTSQVIPSLIPSSPTGTARVLSRSLVLETDDSQSFNLEVCTHTCMGPHVRGP